VIAMRFRVKELAQEQGLTQEELSQRSNVKLATLQRLWQNKGTSDARAKTLFALAGALGVEVKDLYSQESFDPNAISPRLESNKRRALTHAIG
jgi:transcriptional regulator with XRE-family HTH domain